MRSKALQRWPRWPLAGLTFLTLCGACRREQSAGSSASEGRAAPASPSATPLPSAPASPSLFFGESDEALRQALATQPVVEASKGKGGRSLGFKLTLADGTVGYFKPEQSFSGAHWYSEVAAHYLDRELGFGRVPAVIGRRMAWVPLRQAAGGDKRLAEVAVAADGSVRGAFVGWLHEGVQPLRLPAGWENWLRLAGGLRRSPYQRPALLRTKSAASTAASRSPTVAMSEDLAAQLSDLIVFDYLISNVDRWGGDFTNVRRRGSDGPLLFFDNGAGFWPNHRLELMEARLQALQRFRRLTIERLQDFDVERLAVRLQRDPLAPVLSARLLAGVEVRRRVVLEHVAALQRRYGAKVTPW